MSYSGLQGLVNLCGDLQPPIDGHVGILQDGIAAVVAGKFAEGQIALRQQMLLYPSMREPMQRVQGLIETHFAQAHAKPFIKLVPHDHLEASIAVGDLVDVVIAVTSVLSEDINEAENCFHRAKQRIVGSC